MSVRREETKYPFPYFGEGSTRPIRAKDGLLSIVVFVRPISHAEAKAIAKTAPEPMQTSVTTGRRWMSLQTKTPPSAKAVTAWIESVHRAHPVALFFVGAAGKRGAWHVDTVTHYAERVRPIVDALRADGERDHAHWIATNFLREGAPTTFEDLRALADGDPIPPERGDLGRRCLLAMPLVEALGPASLSALGPYAELGFWACASIRELVPNPAAHAEHLVALGDACPKGRASVVPLLLVMAACSLMRDSVPLMVKLERPPRTPEPRPESFDAALSIARRASPLDAALLEMLLDAARSAGGDTQVAALAERLLPAPDAAAILAPSSAPEVDEHPDATHPHLARLNAERLTVRYRGSEESQRVVVEVTGVPQPGRARHFREAVRDVVTLVELGFAGADVFPPELGRAKIVEGSSAEGDGHDFRWTLETRGVAPSFWAIALHLLANPREYYERCEVTECPEHVSIVGALEVDASPASVTTESMLALLRDPTPAFRAFPEVPFAVQEEKSAKAVFVVKPKTMHPTLADRVQSVVYALPKIFSAHPAGLGARLVASPDVGKTQVKASWSESPIPPDVTRGPLLDMARRIHVEVTPLTSISLVSGTFRRQ